MNKSRFLWTLVGALLLMEGASAQNGPIRLAFRGATVDHGTFDVPIYVDSTMTGRNVTSYQIEFTYSNPTATYAAAVIAGTLTAGWDVPTVNEISPGRIRIAGAGTTALTGTGPLVTLQFTAPARTYAATVSFTFQSALLNEGSPTTVLTNASMNIRAVASVAVSPNTAVVLRGETLQFSASGGQTPYVWSSTNPAAATISGTGLLTGQSVGTTYVVATDANSVVDTSGIIEIRGMRLSLRDTSRYQGQFLDLPVYTSSLAGLNILSGQITIAFNTSYWIPVGVIQAGTLTDGSNLEYRSNAGSVNVSFGGTTPITGSGILFFLRMQASTSVAGSIGFSFSNVVFNESLAAVVQGASITNISRPAISINPSGAFTMMTGDSVQLGASGGIPPYAWSVSHPAKATISSAGWLKAKRGGTITATATDAVGGTGTSGAINIYDLRIQLTDTTFNGKGQVEYPIRVSTNDTGFTSFQFVLSYSTYSRTRLVGVNTTGTLTQGWSVLTSPLPGTDGNVTIAGASGGLPNYSSGILLRLVFNIPDTAIRPSNTAFSFATCSFNEGLPRPLTTGGTISLSGTVDVETQPMLPTSLGLEQNYPNPFNPTTVVRYQVPVAGRVELRVFDLVGREVAVLVNEEKSPGTYTATWDATGMTSGTYFYRLQAEGKTFTRRMVLLR